MLSLVLYVCVGIIFSAVFTPYLYSCITWNYSLAVFSAVSIYTNCVVFLVLLFIYLLLPDKVIDYLIQKLSAAFRSSFHALIEKTEKNIRETFKIHVLHKIPERSINIWHPHGMSGLTPVIHNGYKITDSSYKSTKGVVHTFFFKIPVVKDIIRHLNAIPSDYSSMKRVVTTESISVALGGAKEMQIFKDKNIDVVVKTRKGIFKIALETGTPIVPVLTYGENEIFPKPKNSLIECMNDQFYNFFRVRLPVLSVTSLQNWQQISKHPLEPIHSYTGRPIHVKKIEFPTENDIKKLRSKYIRRVKELFKETNRGDFTLNII